jgi:hypothetical protein
VLRPEEVDLAVGAQNPSEVVGSAHETSVRREVRTLPGEGGSG